MSFFSKIFAKKDMIPKIFDTCAEFSDYNQLVQRGARQQLIAIQYRNGGWVYADQVNSAKNIESFRVLTFNILKDELPGITVNERVKYLLQTIDSSVDIICLQEVTKESIEIIKNTEWVQSCGYFITDISGFSLGAEANSYGTLILSKFPIHNVNIYTFEATLMIRKFLIVEVMINNKIIAVCTVHLESLEKSFKIRNRQLNEIFEVLNKYENVIFAGDFNFNSSWEEDKKNNKLIIDNGYKNSDSLATATVGINYANNEKFRDVIGDHQPGDYDRIYFKSNMFNIDSIKIGGNVANKKEILPSDHLFVMAKFVINNNL